MGLYGVGGIGKIMICKVLCNEFFKKYWGRVFYVELERGSEEELLKEVLRRFIDIKFEFLDVMNVDEV